MLSTAARARLTVVLVGARNPSNIGAAARAMQDFGFSDLRIVNDFAAPFEAAQLEAKSAVAAQHVMRNARRYDTLAAAIADCTLIVATTAIGERQLKHPILPLQQAAPLLLAALAVTTTTGAPCLDSETWAGNDPNLPPSAQDPGAPCLDSETWAGNDPNLPPSAQHPGAPCLDSETWAGNDPNLPPSAQDPGAPCLDSETWAGNDPNPPPSAQDPGAPSMTASSSWVGSNEPQRPDSTKIAILFGSEKTGLTNDQLSHATLLTTIPMFSPSAAAPESAARHLSMNLGQSVAVCLYELTRSGFESSVEIPPLHEAPATAEDRERLTQLLLDVLHATGYTRRFPANASEPLIRQLIQQLAAPHREARLSGGLTHRQAETLMGIFRQILWHENQNPKI